MRIHRVLPLVALGACLAAVVTPVSATGPDVAVTVSQLKEVVLPGSNGQERIELREVKRAEPGDTLVYEITYTNQGDAPAHNAVVVDPVPDGTVLVPGDWNTTGTAFTVSIDGGDSFEPYPVRRPVRTANGAVIQKDVDHTLYTHVRWTVQEPLRPGESRSARFKVRVR